MKASSLPQACEEGTRWRLGRQTSNYERALG